jgi:DNA (cytosine-5)-methyltransferase 1
MSMKWAHRPDSTTFVDLFAGMGGLSAGLRDAGLRALAAVEVDPDAQETYQANHPGVPVFGDIRGVTAELLLAEADVNAVDVVVGCPPCQGFTRLTEGRERDDPRNVLVLEFLRLVKELRPTICMMENVPGLITRGQWLFERLVGGLKRAGYVVTYDVLELANYGVPQLRKRLVLMAGLGHPIALPRPTHHGPKQWRTVRDAIGRLPRAPSRSEVLAGAKPAVPWHISRDSSMVVQQRLAHALKHGGSRRTLPSALRLGCHERYVGGFNDVYGVLDWDAPSRTITSGCTNASKGRFGHPSEPRPLTPREAAMLQTLGRKYKLKGVGFESISQQIGNALPRRFAKVAGRHILRELDQLMLTKGRPPNLER